MKSLLCLSVVVPLLISCGYKEAQLKDQEDVQTAMSHHDEEIQTCYREALKQNPSLPSGSMTIRAEHHWDGTLHAPQLIRGFAGSNEIFDCVSQKVTSWKLPPPRTWGPVEFSWEFKNVEMIRQNALKDFGSMMKDSQPLFAECFEREVRRNPEIQGGEIRFKFIRGASGQVTQLQQTEGFQGSGEVFSCMSKVIGSFDLAPIADDTKMTWSYRFNRLDSNIATGETKKSARQNNR